MNVVGIMRKLIIVFISCAWCVNAQTSVSGVVGSVVTKTNISSAISVKSTARSVPATTNLCNVSNNPPLSVKLLDECWNNREDTNNQKAIADYLMTLPKVPNDFEIAWKTARLVYFIGNYGLGEKRFVDTSDGVTLFDYGANAGLLASKLNAKAVEGFYWYGVDLGSYGLAKGVIASASHAKDGMNALFTANKINSAYHWFGSNRILGRYYQELPGIFGGDSDRAYRFISAATQEAPNFRNNWVFLGQYYISAGQYDKAFEACNKAVSLPSVDGKYEELRYYKEAKQCVLKAKSKLE